MSQLYPLFVNPKILSYISSEFINYNKIDVSNPNKLNQIQQGVKKALDETFSLLDKSKISKNNVSDAIEKFVNVTLKRLQVPIGNKNPPMQGDRRMPAQYSANTRFNNENDSIDNKYNKYMENYREFAHSTKPPEVPEWLQGKQTNPKRMQDEHLKKTPLEQFKGTATRAPPKHYSSSGLSGENEPKNDIQDYGGSTNFSFFNEETEIKSAFDDAFYTTGIDPDNINEDNETLEAKLKKMESMRGSITAPQKKVENIHELFNQEAPEVNQNIYNNDKDLPKIHQQYNQQYQQQQQQYKNMTPQMMQPPQYQPPQQQQQNGQQQQLVAQLQMMHGKVVKYEDYLKTLMEKYNELKNERDNIKHKLLNMNETNTNKYTSDAMEEKKKELIQLSTKVQEQIRRLEELQESGQNNQEE
jgi:hypothetical protein